MSSAREEILSRVVVPARAHGALARDYRRAGTLGEEERVALFCRRVGEYRAHVERIDEADVAATVDRVRNSRSLRTLVVPAGLPRAWRGTGDFAEDDGLTPRELDAVDGALTGCTAAIAETGTIVLTSAPAEGRRALTLVPDLHVCVVRESQIVELVPEALARLAAAGLERRPVTFISGPSATSDIELSRVEGVHGPRTLIVLAVKDVTPPS
jgi:L-lactate dehydrogenase complex protein LldG